MPHTADSFVGRTDALAELKDRLSTRRMATILGVGGGGKTRLALEFAAQMERSGAFADGVWIAELDSVNDEDMLYQAVLSAVDAPDQSTRKPLPTLVNYLKDKQLLLVLDNCEHQMPTVGKLATTLLRASPGLRIVATSRTHLGSEGETIVSIRPMSLPPHDAPPPNPPYEQYEAVQMFWTLVEASVPEWQITEDNWPYVVQMLRGIDGIPLAIKLVTVRLRSMSITDVVARMDDLFALLNKNDLAPDNHETLEAVFRWNLTDCTEAEKLLWARASVFAGTFTLTAAEEVCADDELPRERIADALRGLVESSTVEYLPSSTRSSARYRLLAPLRQFGTKLLAERGEQERLHQRLRRHYRDVGAAAAGGWYCHTEFDVLDETAADLSNFRAVMSAYVTSPDPEQTGLQIAVDLARTRLYFRLGKMREVISWLSRTLAATPNPDPQLEIAARALDLFVDLCIGADEADIRPRLEYLQARAVELGQPAPPVWFAAGVARMWLHGSRDGMPLLEQAYTAFRAVGPSMYGDAAMPLMLRAVGEALMGDQHQAGAAATRFADETRIAGAPWMIRWAEWCAAIVEMRFGRPARAGQRLEHLLRDRTSGTDNWLTMWIIELLAWAAAKVGAGQRAAVLLGMSSQLNKLTGVQVHKIRPFATHRREAEATAERLLGTTDYHAAFASGTHVRNVAEARDLALKDSGKGTKSVSAGTAQDTAQDTASQWNLLTATEQEIALLIKDGLTNKEIAARRFVSPRTVDSQLLQIRQKIGVEAGRAIVVWIYKHAPHHNA